MSVIEINNLTKDFGAHRGVFDINISINKGEVYGFIGPNGAGKTTTIRQLLGFMHPDRGAIYINGIKVEKEYYLTNKIIGYLPGEVNLPDDMTGDEFLRFVKQMHNVNNEQLINDLINLFELRHYASKIKKMSKGMKQKLGIIACFMSEPEIYILDEPTSGLDPIMQERFLALVKKEAQKGKTVLMSSHSFSEVEKVCDRVSFIKNGEIVSTISLEEVRHSKEKSFNILFKNKEEADKYLLKHPKLIIIDEKTIKITFKNTEIKEVFNELNSYEIENIFENRFSLEDYFIDLYKDMGANAI